MEGVPNEMPNNDQEKELSFEQQTSLARVLFSAVHDRNDFIERFGGFDTFAEAWQHVGDNRKVFDEMELAVENARKEFDQKISDKKQFANNLRNSGEVEMADLISMMFGSYTKEPATKGGILSRVFRKK